MAKAFLIVLGLAASPSVIAGQAIAQAYESAYTALELGQCQQQPLDPEDPVDGGVWWCEGYGGMPVRVAEGDLRYLVSFGANAATEPAAGETLPQFNRIHTTLEWRLATNPADGRRIPIATILRYFTQNDGSREGQVLVVTKIGGPGQVCHIGYVDALLNPEANGLARQVAEAVAAQFVCGQRQPGYYGVAPQ
ncbi:MAG TPA: hypothetical protein VKN76_17205 [Kiloniellaceae bacterium]|nr:hypothetical protein [Kiloniellaceae bacterium]